MTIDPDTTQRVLIEYLEGRLSCSEAAERIAANLSPIQRLTFVIQFSLEHAATPEGRTLGELREMINRSGWIDEE